MKRLVTRRALPTLLAVMASSVFCVLVVAETAIAAKERPRQLGQAASTYRWNLPPGFPEPKVPVDNQMSDTKVELGRRLFYDKRLSGNQTFSCGNCHLQSRAFADALPRGVGSTGERHPRGSMALANVAYAPVLTWANPNVRSLEQQALLPMFGEAPVELGLAGREGELLQRLHADSIYRELFDASFGERPSMTVQNITRALAAFERTLISGRSPYDRFAAGDSNAISRSAKRGQELFFSEKLECFHCHGGFNFTNTVDYKGKGFAEIEFHNTGLYNIGGRGAYPQANPGLREHSGRADDMGKFKAPSLRNIALTAPYMHDGSVKTLDEALDHYGAGGRTIASGPNAGVGRRNPFKSSFVKGFVLSARERRDVLAFLRSLTDSVFVTDPRFSNPFSQPN